MSRMARLAERAGFETLVYPARARLFNWQSTAKLVGAPELFATSAAVR
jgi:hypothetical protein